MKMMKRKEMMKIMNMIKKMKMMKIMKIINMMKMMKIIPISLRKKPIHSGFITANKILYAATMFLRLYIVFERICSIRSLLDGFSGDTLFLVLHQICALLFWRIYVGSFYPHQELSFLIKHPRSKNQIEKNHHGIDPLEGRKSPKMTVLFGRWTNSESQSSSHATSGASNLWFQQKSAAAWHGNRFSFSPVLGPSRRGDFAPGITALGTWEESSFHERYPPWNQKFAPENG